MFPHNDPAVVDAVLTAAGLKADDALRASLLTERDVTTLSVPMLEKFARRPATATSAQLVADGQARAWIEGRQLIDLLEAYPATLTAEQLTAVTRPLPPRAYSIASSRKEVGDEAHLLVAAVRYQSHGRDRAGVASTFVADRLQGGRTRAGLAQAEQAFPAARRPGADVIMIGPGTGIAPFRAFVQERRATGATRPQLAVLRRPALHPRLPVPARMAGRAGGGRR